MKDILKEYYGLVLEYSRNYNDGLIFFVNGDYYYLCKCNLDSIEVTKSYELYLILKGRNIVLHDFIYNNKGELLSNGYVLLKLNYIIDDIDINDLKRLDVEIDYDLNDDFYNLWINKIDYIETQLVDMSQNNLINYSFDYFVGIAEMILRYYKDNTYDNSERFIVHRVFYNLSTVDFYNPLNIVLGNRYKDIASYIRLTDNWDLLYNLLNNISYKDKASLFVRLSFPFYYFNLVNNSLVDGIDEEKVLYVIKDIDKYEEYLWKLEKIFGIKLFYFIKKDN